MQPRAWSPRELPLSSVASGAASALQCWVWQEWSPEMRPDGSFALLVCRLSSKAMEADPRAGVICQSFFFLLPSSSSSCSSSWPLAVGYIVGSCLFGQVTAALKAGTAGCEQGRHGGLRRRKNQTKPEEHCQAPFAPALTFITLLYRRQMRQKRMLKASRGRSYKYIRTRASLKIARVLSDILCIFI